jgi:cold shock CspA family protein
MTTMINKQRGIVKWFSNKLGYGFISASSSDPDTPEREIFLHYSNIEVEQGNFRSIEEGTEVEFEVELLPGSQKEQAIHVTLPGGSSLPMPKRRPRKLRGKPTRNRRRKKRQQPLFRDAIDETIREKIKERGLDLASKNTVDVAIGDARIKLGSGSYAGFVHKDGIVAEGTYSCDEEGTVVIDWSKSLIFVDGKWVENDPSSLLSTFSLTDDNVGPVKLDETLEALWGSDKDDPGEAFEKHGFLMRKVVLTKPPRREREP